MNGSLKNIITKGLGTIILTAALLARDTGLSSLLVGTLIGLALMLIMWT